MNPRLRTAQTLIALGCLIVLAGAALHLLAAYPKVSAALAASNLDSKLAAALRAVFFLIAIGWIAIAAVTLIATFSHKASGRPTILFCGFALLLMVPIWVGLMGWFIGNEMFLAAGALIVGGGALFKQGLS